MGISKTCSLVSAFGECALATIDQNKLVFVTSAFSSERKQKRRFDVKLVVLS
ncbi:MAG: hypothetical protein ACI8RD_008990 [Bacillariaceae sp.]|jgi:hypothetical protein